MKTRLSLAVLLTALSFPSEAQQIPASSQADSVWLYTYCTTKNDGKNGLHFAWSTDYRPEEGMPVQVAQWNEIGPEWAPVKSDYGTWGAQKRMLQPWVTYNAEKQMWEATWRVNEQESVVAYTNSKNLSLWKPQDYYALPGEKIGTAKLLEDFAGRAPLYSESEAVALSLPISGEVKGQLHRVAWPVVYSLLTELNLQRTKDAQNAERAVDDKTGMFRDLKSQHIAITISAEGQKQISDKLIGIFFEDINYAADGGLYAEMVENRDFEYNQKDGKGWNAQSRWSAKGVELSISTDNPIHENNPHYAVVKVAENAEAEGLINYGWDQPMGKGKEAHWGFPVKSGAKYDFSLFGRVPEGKSGKVAVSLVGRDGSVLAQGFVNLPKGESWKKVSVVLKAVADAEEAKLVLKPTSAGTYHLDMVSLFPQDTYKGRKNGMRKDMAEALEALHPQFVRFPGGCASHGNGIDNIYRWKNTIGPLESRKPDWNIWHYHQTVGLGYYEYFQLCEDLGARPLPVLAAGVPCQNSSVGGAGQQGGIPMDQMDEYVQDVLDLIEWANGDPKSSKWAKMRAEAGHPKPFGLQMIGIGNEDLISDVFEVRYKMICKAVKEKYPEMQIVGTVGPWCEGSDYEYGWRLAREMQLDLVDEHYYNSPGWFINNQDYYDHYARTYINNEGKRVPSTKVYLGEYASHIGNRTNCIETALSEALYLCSVERNADIVEMTSYAPLFAKQGHTQWNPDLIYFTNNEVMPTTGYQVQKLFGQNAGTTYLPSQIRLGHHNGNVLKRIGHSAVIDPATGDLILKLVNYLPVANHFTIEVPEAFDSIREAQVLTGELKDTRAVPTALENVSLGGNSIKFEAPAYSFVVIRVGKPVVKKR